MVPFSVENQIVAAIRKIIQAVDLHSRRLVETVGLTGPQLAVLREATRRGPTPIGALAKAVHLSQPTVTGVLDRLARRGLVERTRDHSDRRAVNVRVTEAGRQLVESAPSLLQDRFHRRLEELQPWEQTLILSTLQRIAAMMDAESLDASPHLVTSSPAADVPDNSRPAAQAEASGGMAS